MFLSFATSLTGKDREGLSRTKFCESICEFCESICESLGSVKDGRLATLSQTANNPASVYVFAVRRISLCRMISIAIRGGVPTRAKFVASVYRSEWKSAR